jgi:Tol biopolymer transport system component
MKKTLLPFVVVLTTTALVGRAQSPAPRGSAAGLTIEQLIDIRHPSNPMWSPDGRSVVFLWDRAGVSKVYVVALDGGSKAGAPRELAGAGSSLAGAAWSADGRALLVPKDGDLWRVPIDGSAPPRQIDPSSTTADISYP